MSRTLAYPWRSSLSRRLFADMTDAREQLVFTRLVLGHRLGEDQLRALVNFWTSGRLPGESFVRFLVRTGQVTADATR